ncbi:hypothetical protein HMPREF1983_00240 [Gemella bergeri ATCC 700627]|uniref:Uncharacterized protein n=1 Tax=Gemella bergeri ATCC 700627 TaxID=1321820 RepID=U2QBM1_9BACL|nr:hypothetical protein HMPREF1983_00240 [Gemella bergeri ATCC 700627]
MSKLGLNRFVEYDLIKDRTNRLVVATNNLFLTLFVKIKVAFAYVVPKCFMIASLLKNPNVQRIVIKKGAFV